MATKKSDFCGLTSQQLLMNMTVHISSMLPGDILEVTANCDTFEEDVRRWCAINKKEMKWIKDAGNGTKQCQISA